MRSPSKAARLLLALVVCSTIFADYWEYSRAYHATPDIWMDVARGTAAAPQQYRIGVVWAAGLLSRHGHMGLRHAFTLIDFFSVSVAVFLLYSLFERTLVYRAAGHAARWFGAAAFVFLVQYYLVWTTWYQRPETLASAAVVAATLWLLSVRLPLGRPASIVLTSCAILLLAGMQGFIRADAAVALHLGILLVCLTNAGNGFALPRGVQACTSLLAVLIAAGVQYYLMHVAYPHASYGSTDAFALPKNITDWQRQGPFALYMLPSAWVAVTLARRRLAAESPGLGLAAGSAIYLALWLVMGKIDEVRIFLPYALALVPLTCACAIERFAAAAVDPPAGL